MAKIISQETFDDIVKENVVDFAMTPDEAKLETIQQFEAQGITLANIIKDLAIDAETGRPVINETVAKIKDFLSENSTETDKMLDYLTLLHSECKKSLPHRVLAAKNGAHDLLINLLENWLSADIFNEQLVIKCLQALNSLTNKQPDLFNAKALDVALKLLGLKEQDDIIRLTLQWLQKVCIMHETNRQRIMGSNALQLMKPLLSSNNTQLLRELTAVFRFLVLDDDIRVEFGCAHLHAKDIASVVLMELVEMLPTHNDANLLADLMLTIATLAVRQELCSDIDNAGGLTFIFDIMRTHMADERINCEALKLLRALGGHDTVKKHIVQNGVAPIIKQMLETHQCNENIVSAAFACITTLTLRVKEHSDAFFGTGIAEVIVESLRVHAKHKIVQRNGAWAIRNMVSRSREQCDTWLSFGVEDLLNTAMTEHPSIKQDIKAALRDLGCAVDLREEWTGTAEKKIAA